MKQWNLSLHIDQSCIQRWKSSEGTLHVGSSPDCELNIPNEQVSPRHAALSLGQDYLEVEDLESGIGTRVNGCDIEGRVQVEYPAALQIGDYEILIEERKSGAPGPKDHPVPAPHRFIGSASSVVDYGLSREIARGGMGRIYEGIDGQLKRSVAVKISVVSDTGVDPRFSKESEVLAQLAHPNIVPIYSCGQDGEGRPFYSMKLVKGRTLQAIINQLRDGEIETRSQFTRERLLGVYRKVCDAMSFAHANRILHRDLKPENIMVGEFGEVLVMDWGLAKVIGDKSADLPSKTSEAASTLDFSMTMEGEVMGTPQYMSPEQADGMVADLDERSDIYSLGAILYATLTLRPPVEGTTLDEVLTKVRSGRITSMSAISSKAGKRSAEEIKQMGREIPEGLEAVTMKAMSTNRDNRHQTVEDLANDIDAFQHGFVTSAESAGIVKRTKLWINRNKVLSIATSTFLVVVSAFTLQVIREGRRATQALRRLQEMAPMAAARAEDALKDGDFEEALRIITYAVDLDPNSALYRRIRGHAFQLLMRFQNAIDDYSAAVKLGDDTAAQENLSLTETLLKDQDVSDPTKTKALLFAALNKQGRNYEAIAFGRDMKDFWGDRTKRNKDPNAVFQLSKILEPKLLMIPGTNVLMSSTELTVGEWKLYLDGEGLTDWKQPVGFTQSDSHPVVEISWDMARNFCEWLSKGTGKEWRLPTQLEWETAVGKTKFPWGDHWPPKAFEANYSITSSGQRDPSGVGADGIRGTARVGSFKPNALGFYDLAGNVWEWCHEQAVLRGGGFADGDAVFCETGRRDDGQINRNRNGFRVVQRIQPPAARQSKPAGEAQRQNKQPSEAGKTKPAEPAPPSN